MKKLFTICMILLIAVFSMGQAPWMRDDPSKISYLKFDQDKTGFGTNKPTEKVTIQGTGGESLLGLKQSKNQSNSSIKFYSNTGAVVAELWVTPYGLIIGKKKDTTSALLVMNMQKGYLKLNGSALNFGSGDTVPAFSIDTSRLAFLDKSNSFTSDQIINGINIGVGAYNSIDNISFGLNTLNSNISSTGNTAIGSYALASHKEGGLNIAVGFESLKNDTAGLYNTSIGAGSLIENKNGNLIIALGYNSGYYETRSNKIHIGTPKTNTNLGTDTVTEALYINEDDNNAYLNRALILGNVVTDTTDPKKGKIVFKASDSTMYYCRSLIAAKKWYPMYYSPPE